MYVNPYAGISKHGRWLKANFHTHAGTGAGTCGAHGLLEVIIAYKDADYNVLTISNHDLFTPTQGLVEGIRLIHGVEYSRDPHMLSIGAGEHFNAPHQETVDKTNQAGGFIILCHPNWIHKEYWPYEKIDNLKGYVGIEIVNQLIYRLSGSGLATDTWDYLLSRGKLVFGFSNDDFHHWRDLGRSFNVIYAQSDDYADIKKAISEGSFFASTGVYLDTLTLENNELYVKAKYPIDTYIDEFTYTVIGENGHVLKTLHGKDISYKLTNETYIRVQAAGENGFMMFLQPIYNADLFARP